MVRWWRGEGRRQNACDTLRDLKTATPWRSRLPAWTPLLLALPLYAAALGWGWGPEQLWTWDEPRPAQVLGVPYTGGESWPARYPLLHRDFLRLLYSTVDPAAELLGVDNGAALDRVRFLAGRSLTLLLALLTVHLAFLVAQRGRSIRAGWIAALAWLAVLPQTYYAKTMNLDAPYVFWLAVASWGFVRLRAEPRLKYAVAFFGGGAAAVLTKDQSFGLFVLPGLFLLAEVARGRWHSVGGRRVAILFALPALGAALLAAASYRLAGGTGLWERHLAAVLAAPDSYAFTAPDLASALDRWRLALRHVIWSFSLPLALVIAVGVALALVRRRQAIPASSGKSSAILLLFPISYFLFALVPLGYNYDRFFLPVCWILVVVAGGALSDFSESLGSRNARALLILTIGGALSWGLWRCLMLDSAMAQDRRLALEVATRGVPRVTLARHALRAPQGFVRLALPAHGDLPLAALSPFAVVAIPVRDLGDLRLARLVRQLRAQACGFRRTNPELSRPSPLHRWVDFAGVLSNLSEVDPPLLVFRRDPPLAPCAEVALPWASGSAPTSPAG